MTGILEPFFASCRRVPDRVALIDRDGTEITYAALDREARALAGHWRERGLEPGRRVLVAAPVSIGLYRSLIAIWMAGCEAIFPEPSAGLAGLRHACGILNPDAVVSTGLARFAIPILAGRPMRPLATYSIGEDDRAPEPPSDVALYSFTSGSTGTPKCIPRSHEFMLAQSGAVSRLLVSDRHEVDLVWFPVFVLACLANGGTAVLAGSNLRRPDKPDTRRLAAQCRDHCVTRILAPPAVADALARDPLMPRIDKVFTGGGPVMPHHFACIGRYTDEIVAVYGSTEAEPIAALSSRDVTVDLMSAMTGGSGLLAGHPVEGIAVRIHDDEIQVAGPHVVRSYLDPGQNGENKILDNGVVWHRTGDGGRIDESGRLWLLGRLKGRVGRHWPLEVEVTAQSWPGVHACALTQTDGKPILAIVGDRRFEQEWRQKAQRLSVAMLPLKALPMDRRHASKLDYARLEEVTRNASQQ